MSHLTLSDLSPAELRDLVRTQVMLLPSAGDAGAQALTTSVRFPLSGVLSPGDSVIVCADAAFHMLAGPSSVVAETNSPKFPAGLYAFTVPDGCTHVAMIQSSAGAAVGQAYRG